MGAASAADGREGVTAAAPAAATAAAAAGRDQVTTTADYSRRARPVSPATGGGAFAARRSLQGQRRPRARGHRGAAVGMAASKARAAADGAGLPPAAVGRRASVAAGVLAGTAAATAAAVSAAAAAAASVSVSAAAAADADACGGGGQPRRGERLGRAAGVGERSRRRPPQ